MVAYREAAFDPLTVSKIVTLYGPLLQRIARRFFRCREDAEDLVQDTFLRWMNADTSRVTNVRAYLVQILTNQALNRIKSLKSKPVDSFEALSSLDNTAISCRDVDIDFMMDMRIQLRSALRLINSKLEPIERAVYLLREVFSIDYDELQAILKKRKDHCRQILSRSKKKLDDALSNPIRGRKPNFASAEASNICWQKAFEKACEFGLLGELVQYLQRDLKLAST